MRRGHLNLVASLGLAAFLCGPTPAPAQVAPPLGVAKGFGVLGASTVTNTGATVVTGDLGTSPGTAITGFPPGVVVGTIHAGGPVAMQAQQDVVVAYNNLAGQACTTNLTGQDLGGLTLGPGVYCFNSSAQLTGNLILDAQGDSNAVFVFQMGSTLTTASNSIAFVNNGGRSCNVFWQVGSSATLGTNSTVAGSILALTSITLTTGSRTLGSAYALNAAVTLDTNVVTACATPPPPVCPTVTLSPATLPNGAVGIAYNQGITGNGGQAPYTFAVTAGALPPGLTLSSAGALAGTPTTTGSFNFTVRGTDLNGCFGDRSYSLVIAPTCPVIVISPPTLPSGKVAVAYSQTISASGGLAPYTFAVTAGTLPAGLTLASSGALTGTPTSAGTSNFTVRGTDANGCFAERAYAIAIAPPPPPPPVCPVLAISPPALPGGTVAVAYAQILSASGGTAPYSFGLTAGALPPGLTLAGSGFLTGTPTSAGSFAFTVRGTDVNGCFAERAYTILIAPPPPPPPGCPAIAITPPALPGATVGVAYNQTLVASGGTPPYSFGVTSGVLPDGLALTSTGVLTGIPTTPGTSAFTVRGTDANGCFGEIAYSMVVPGPTCPLITLLPAALPNGTRAVPYRETMTASGGTGPYTFAVVAGELPAGLTLTPPGVIAGTPTTAGRSTFTIRATDVNGCFLQRRFVIVIPVPVPTLSGSSTLLFAALLAGAGFLAMRQRAT